MSSVLTISLIENQNIKLQVDSFKTCVLGRSYVGVSTSFRQALRILYSFLNVAQVAIDVAKLMLLVVLQTVVCLLCWTCCRLMVGGRDLVVQRGQP